MTVLETLIIGILSSFAAAIWKKLEGLDARLDALEKSLARRFPDLKD
ncbi:MAG: hypothetical protein ACK51W_16435 [Aphanizomenon sp.]